MFKIKSLLYVAIFCAFCYSSECKLEALRPLENYTHSLVVDGSDVEQFQVFWKIIKDEIQFEVHCRTTGWVGLGISPNGGMVGSDIALGWVAKGKAYLLDGYATGLSRPMIDKVQNWRLIEGAEINGYTILKFKRKLLTCDKTYDREITVGTNYLIFAWNPRDPTKDAKDEFFYHGKNRYSNATIVLNYREESLTDGDKLPGDVFKHEVLMRQVALPAAKQTYYHCSLFRMPEFNSSVHLIRLETFLKREENVHSIMLYECDDDYDPNLPLLNRECGPVSLPGDVAIKCESKLVYVWGKGGNQRFDFPKKAGYRFQSSLKNKHVLLKIHYTNKYFEDIPGGDISGLKLYFTKTLRANDIGLMALGMDDAALSIQIPPASNSMTLSSTCYPECSQKFFPNSGIYLVSSLTQLNSAGTSVKTSLARDGKIIGNLFENLNYDSKYQFSIDIEPSKVLPGDALVTSCTYNTFAKGRFTFRGYSSFDDENCVNYVYYYPRVPGFQSCASRPQPKFVYDFYRSLMSDNLLPPKELDNTQYFQNMNDVTTYFKNEVSASSKLRDRYMEFYSSKYNETLFCGNSNDLKNSIAKENVIRYQPKEYVEVKKCSAFSFLMQTTAFTQIVLILISLSF